MTCCDYGRQPACRGKRRRRALETKAGPLFAGFSLTRAARDRTVRRTRLTPRARSGGVQMRQWLTAPKSRRANDAILHRDWNSVCSAGQSPLIAPASRSLAKGTGGKVDSTSWGLLLQQGVHPMVPLICMFAAANFYLPLQTLPCRSTCGALDLLESENGTKGVVLLLPPQNGIRCRICLFRECDCHNSLTCKTMRCAGDLQIQLEG